MFQHEAAKLMKDMACDYTSCCVGARELIQGSNRVGWGRQGVSHQDWNNTKTGPMLRGVVSIPARYTGREVSIAIDPCIWNNKRPTHRVRNRLPMGCVRDVPPRCTMKGSRVYVVVMAAFFAGRGEIKPKRVQASANSTQLARLLSLQGSCQTEPEAFVIIFVSPPSAAQQNAQRRGQPTWAPQRGWLATSMTLLQAAIAS